MVLGAAVLSLLVCELRLCVSASLRLCVVTSRSDVKSKKLHYRQAEFTQHYDRSTPRPTVRARTLLCTTSCYFR